LANGVLTENGPITATYNALNQPMGMWGPAYGSTNYQWFGYDPLGRCVKRWVSPAVGTPPNQQAPPPSTNPATYYYYEGWNLIQEGSSAAAADRTYVHGGRVDEMVASQIGGVWNYHQYDARGHCTLLTDTSGGIREQYDYDAFGIPYFYNSAGTKLLGWQQWGNRFLFTGREWLKELGVYDYRHRMYHPELGRFLQPDPKHFAAGDYNLYRYCHNDPVNKIDPTGLLERNKETGQLRAAVTGNSMEHGGVKYNEVTLRTNAGNPVSAWKAEKSAPDNVERATDSKSNCHGNTFTRGEYWIEPDQTLQIVQDDGWQPATGAQESGIGIFINESSGEATHSVTITGVDSSGSMIVNSKQGISPVQVGIPLSEAGRDYPGTQVVVFTGGRDVYK
jgi:RHS repeat-associated protein